MSAINRKHNDLGVVLESVCDRLADAIISNGSEVKKVREKGFFSGLDSLASDFDEPNLSNIRWQSVLAGTGALWEEMVDTRWRGPDVPPKLPVFEEPGALALASNGDQLYTDILGNLDSISILFLNHYAIGSRTRIVEWCKGIVRHYEESLYSNKTVTIGSPYTPSGNTVAMRVCFTKDLRRGGIIRMLDSDFSEHSYKVESDIDGEGHPVVLSNLKTGKVCIIKHLFLGWHGGHDAWAQNGVMEVL